MSTPDNVEIAASLICAKRNNTDIPKNIKESIKENGNEASDAVIKESAAICSMLNKNIKSKVEIFTQKVFEKLQTKL